MKFLKSFFVLLMFVMSCHSVYSQVLTDSGGANIAPYDTWAKAATDLQTAMDYANTNGISQVWITGGTYNIAATLAMKNNVTVYGGFHVGDAALTDRDWSGNPTILDGGNTIRLIFHDADGTDATAVFDGITLQAGSKSSSHGGAVYLDDVSPTFTNCSFIQNTAPGGRDGGALYLQDVVQSVFTNCYFKNNVATDDGGAVDIRNAGCDPVFTDCVFTSNQANDEGGAIRVEDGSPTFTNCTIDNNSANDTGGGIIVLNGSPSFTACTIHTNTATNDGGGLRLSSGTPVVHRSLIYGNTANDDGGALYVSGGTPGIYTSILRDNTAADRGGAICVNISGGTYYNLTVYNNSADYGGALSTNSNDDPRFKSSIFWGNSATTEGNQVYLEATGSDPYFDYCDIEGGDAAFAGPGSGASYTSSRYANCIDQDPLFVNAGSDDFHLTKPTSPCIGTGDPTIYGSAFPTDEDMDAEKRVRGVVDMGAYETNNPPAIVTSAGADNPGPENVTMDEDGSPTAFNLTLYVQDPDGEDITWTISTPPANGTAAPATGTSVNTSSPTAETINYTPNADYNGTDMFIVQITDGTYTDQITVNVTINAISDPPSFTSTPVTTAKSQQLYTYNITTDDPDLPAEVLTISAPTMPAWLTFTDNGDRTAVLTGTPADSDAGAHNIILEVTDGITTVQQIFTITVSDRFIYVDAAGGGDYLTIQEGIDAAVNGDKVIVSGGTYTENINTGGKTIEIEGNPGSPSSVTINGGGNGAVMTIDQGGAPTIDGFTLTNGSGRLGHPTTTTIHAPLSARYGGGIYCYQSNPTLRNLIIEGNTLGVNGNNGGSGAGIYICNNSNVTLEGPNTIIQNNTSATYRGGGICVDDSNLTIDGVTGTVQIINNATGNYGAGIAVTNTTLDLTNVTISGNTLNGANARGDDLYNHTSDVTTHAGVTISVRYDFP